LLPGQRHDSFGVEWLITGRDFAGLIAEKPIERLSLPPA